MAVAQFSVDVKVSRFWTAVYAIYFLLRRKRSEWLLRRAAKASIKGRPVNLGKFHPRMKLLAR